MTTTPGRPAAEKIDPRTPQETIPLSAKRRRSQRVDIEGVVQFRTGVGGTWHRSNATQLSSSGMLVEQTVALEVGTALAGVLRIENAPLVEFLGEVMRRVDDERLAVRFLYLAEADRDQISRVISRNARPQMWSLGERKTATTLPMWPQYNDDPGKS